MQQKTGEKPLENADNSYNFNMGNKGKKERKFDGYKYGQS